MHSSADLSSLPPVQPPVGASRSARRTTSASWFRPAFDWRRIALAERRIPGDYRRVTDKYFTRTHQVLSGKNLNPWFVGQFFARVPNRGKSKVAGLYDFFAAVLKYSNFIQNGGRIWAVPEGSEFGNTDTVIVVEGYLLDIVELETVNLGLLSAATTKHHFGDIEVPLDRIRERMRAIKRLVDRRERRFGPCPITYFGARHYHPYADEHIYRVLREVGFDNCSTDGGAFSNEREGVGTTPHILENTMCYYHGPDRAIVESMLAFDEVIDPSVPRVCLIDYRNHELDDATIVYNALGKRLHSFRLDTCGENVAQGALASANYADPQALAWRESGRYLPDPDDVITKYWVGHGVTVTAAYALVEHQRSIGFKGAPPMLTSGFSNAVQTEAFVDAESILGLSLMSGLGIGEVTPGIFYKMDAIAFGTGPDDLKVVHKAGRPPKANPGLIPALGNFDDNEPNPYRRLKIA